MGSPLAETPPPSSADPRRRLSADDPANAWTNEDDRPVRGHRPPVPRDRVGDGAPRGCQRPRPADQAGARAAHPARDGREVRGVQTRPPRARVGARDAEARERPGDAGVPARSRSGAPPPRSASSTSSSRSCCCRRIPTTTATSWSRSRARKVGRRRRCSRPTSSACTPSGRSKGLEDRGGRRLAQREGRLRQDRVRGPRPRRLLPAEVRGRRPPCAAGAEDRGPGPHPHLCGDRLGHAGGRPRRGRAEARGPGDQDVDVAGTWRPERQHDLFGDPADAQADRDDDQHPGREVAAPEQGEGDARAARPASTR